MTFDDVRHLALKLPEAAESTASGTTLVVRVDPLEREALLNDPTGTYFITPHYQDHPYILVGIDKADPGELWELLVEAWLERAPKRLAAAHEGELLGRGE
jgi:hypothetical protein